MLIDALTGVVWFTCLLFWCFYKLFYNFDMFYSFIFNDIKYTTSEMQLNSNIIENTVKMSKHAVIFTV